jgi:hypothetical protein
MHHMRTGETKPAVTRGTTNEARRHLPPLVDRIRQADSLEGKNGQRGPSRALKEALSEEFRLVKSRLSLFTFTRRLWRVKVKLKYEQGIGRLVLPLHPARVGQSGDWGTSGKNLSTIPQPLLRSSQGRKCS